MLKGCDAVIDMISEQFCIQEMNKKTLVRKSGDDLLQELGLTRIDEGASRVENCELLQTGKNSEEQGR